MPADEKDENFSALRIVLHSTFFPFNRQVQEDKEKTNTKNNSQIPSPARKAENWKFPDRRVN